VRDLLCVHTFRVGDDRTIFLFFQLLEQQSLIVIAE
jgi:hypothetical protein